MSASTGSRVREWDLAPTQFAHAREDLAGLQAQLRRRGFTGALGLSGDRVTVTRLDPTLGSQELVVMRTRLTGTPPTYLGWSVLAQVRTRTDGTMDVVAAVGAADLLETVVDEEDLAGGICAECGTRPFETGRRLAYLLTDSTAPQAGRIVGASCIGRVFGDLPMIMRTEADISTHLGLDLPQAVTQFFTARTVLATACAATAAFGWSPGTRMGSTSARTAAALSVHGSPRARDALAAHLPRARQLVDSWPDPTQRAAHLEAGVGPREIGRLVTRYANELSTVSRQNG